MTELVFILDRSGSMSGLENLWGDYYRKELSEYLRENVLQVWGVFTFFRKSVKFIVKSGIL